MGIRFNADEIFEIAEKIEQNGVAFYGAAAERVADESAKEFLGKLSEWEKTHVEIFAAMRRELSGKALAETTYDPDNQAALYLGALADTKVFDADADPAALIGDDVSVIDILNTALGLEKDSILFYVGMRDLVPGDLGKDRLEGIIAEEMSHVTMLNDEIAKLQ